MTAIPLVVPRRRPWTGLGLGAGEWALFGFIAAYAAIALVLLVVTGAEQASAFHAYFLVWPAAFFVVFPAIYALMLLLRIVHRVPQRRARLRAVKRAVSPAHLRAFATGLVLLAALMLFQGAFTSIKTALPLWTGGFPHDRLQADIDQALHFGVDPWRYLAAIGSDTRIRAFVEWNYNQGWFIYCYGFLFFLMVSEPASKVRIRYLAAYMMTWIVVGNVLAGLFLSAGPAFYGDVTGDAARFSDQLRFLATDNHSQHAAVAVQSYLWDFYSTGQSGLGSGISAFPSMHVALVTLNALFTTEASRRWGAVAFAYVALVLASSVYLAWHYAIDGYAAIAVTVVIYVATRRFLGVKAA